MKLRFFRAPRMSCLSFVQIVAPLGVLVALAASPAPARASDDAAARDAFKEGAVLVEQAEWSAALAAFERSRALREHALTVYNIGVCQRFLGHYTRALETLGVALKRNEETQEMPQLFVDQAKVYAAEIDRKLSHVVISVSPRATAIAIEGRPLTPAAARPDAFIAGVAPAGAGKSVERDRFEVLVDPGTAVFTFSLEGHDTIEVRKELKPGATVDLPVSMTEQAATVSIAADRPRALVRVDDADVGLTPVLLSRPPGTYRVVVSKPGYETYQTKLALRPGQHLRMDATLVEERAPLTKKWWFWTIASAAAVGIGVSTYFVVRPGPTRPDVQRGGLNWAAEVQ